MNCIKCGREIPEGELFCVECSLTPASHSEPQSGTVRLPKVKKPAKAQDTKPLPRPDAKGAPARKSRPAAEPPRRSRKAAVAIVLLSLLLAGSLAFIIWNAGSLAVQRARLRTRDADLTLREQDLTNLEAERDSLQQQLDAANSTVESLEAEIADLKSQLNQSQGANSQAQYDMTSQKQELDKLVEENSELLTTVEDLEANINQLDNQIDQLRSLNAVTSEKSNFLDTYVVFVNNDGSKLYHKYDCPNFNKSSFWAYSRKLAESNGYDPCPTCCK